MQTTIDLLTALTAMLAAIGGVLAVVLVQGRKAHAEADRMDAETRAMLARIDDNAAAAKDQTTNSHSMNLRDDLDEHRHLLDLLVAEQSRSVTAIDGLSADVREVRAAVARMDSRSHDTHRDLYRRLRSLECGPDDK